MRTFLLAAVAAVLVLAGAAPAAARPAAHPAAARACTETDDFLAQYGNQPNWAEADWTANSCGWYIRGFAHCQNGRNYILYTGGWVTSLNLESRASCTTGYPVLAGGGHDIKTCGTCAYTRVWNFGHVKRRRAP